MRYRTIVADPPWRYTKDASSAQRMAGRGGRAESHYPTMTWSELAALDVASLAEDEAHLYVWITNPRLLGSDDGTHTPRSLLAAWGFKYQTTLTWVKTGAPGLGFYFRGMTEHVLFATRGGLQIPPDIRAANVFTAPRAGHSAKPDAFLDLVETVSPGPYLELFARRQRLGWDTFGNEALNHVELPS